MRIDQLFPGGARRRMDGRVIDEPKDDTEISVIHTKS